MKLVSYVNNGQTGLGVLEGHNLFSVQELDKSLPNDILALLNMGEKGHLLIKTALEQLKAGQITAQPVADYHLLAPVPHPTSCRDGYAFRQHVAAARRNRGVEMIKEFDQYPFFILPITWLFRAPVKSIVCPIIFSNWILNWK